MSKKQLESTLKRLKREQKETRDQIEKLKSIPEHHRQELGTDLLIKNNLLTYHIGEKLISDIEGHIERKYGPKRILEN